MPGAMKPVFVIRLIHLSLSIIQKIMERRKKLSLQELVDASKPSIESTRHEPEMYEFIIGNPGKFNLRTGTYYAFGWGVQRLYGMVYWRADCSKVMAGIRENQFISAVPSGSCPQGQRFLINYRG